MKRDAQRLRKLLENILDGVPDGEQTGVMLSGGLDSSVLACILLSKGRAVRSISASFTELSMYDETDYIKMIEHRYPQLETNFISPLDIDLPRELEELITIIGEPISSGSPLLQYLMFKRARELGFRNLIYGQWPDELMGGYDPFLLARAYDDFRDLKISDAMINIREYVHRSKRVGTDLIPLRIMKTLVTSKGLRPALRDSIPNLQHLVGVAQKTARALGLHLILPYGDSRIAEFCQSLAPDRLVCGGQTKIILREAAADIVPEGILKRRRKFGFFGPDAIWLSNNREEIQDIEDKTVEAEYTKFLNNPQKRWYKKLWLALSTLFLHDEKDLHSNVCTPRS